MNTNKATITRIIFALAVIAFGFGALLGAVGLYDFGSVIGKFWPLFIVLGGILMFINNPRQPLWPILAVFIGTLFQLQQFELISFSVWSLFWPLIIIGIGLSILINRSDRRLKGSAEDTSVVNALLSGADLKNHSSDYKGGNLSATLGGVKLDLREATIKKSATINVFCLMGGVELIVPKGWKIQSNITPILGSVDGSKVETPGTDGPTLILKGDVILGGVDIKH